MYKYLVTKEVCGIPGCRYVMYGLQVQEKEIRQISGDRRAVEALAERCTRLALDPIHLEDVVQDFLWELANEAQLMAV